MSQAESHNSTECARPPAVQTKPRRKPALLGATVNTDWLFPGSNVKLVLEVAHDDFGNRYLNDVTDALGHSFPYEDIELQGKPLEDVLVEYVRWLPDLLAEA